MGFQKIVVIVAVVVLIIILIGVGVSLGNGYAERWPPTIANCPDYWEDTSGNGNGNTCVNSKKLGTCNIPTAGDTNAMDFDSPPFNQSDSKCSQYKWAANCGVVWDGITSGVPNPCNDLVEPA